MASESMDVDGGSSTPRAGAGAGAQQPQSQRSSRRPRLVAYAAATSSSASGSLTTTYTSGSSHSHLQSSSGDGGLAPLVALSARLELEEEREKMGWHMMCNVQEFSAAIDDDEATTLVLERWFSDLGIRWVLSIVTDGNSSFSFPQRLGDLARSWIDALKVIQLSISTYLNGSCNQEEGDFSSVPASSELARFLQSTLLKMLRFADAVVSAKVNDACILRNLWEAMVPAEEKLQALIGVRHALSEASQHIQEWYLGPPFLGPSRGIIEQTSSFLSAKLAKLDEAVFDTVDEVRTRIMFMNPQTMERSPDIHMATKSTVNCIKILSTDYWLVSQIVSQAASLGKYVPQYTRISNPFSADPLSTLIMEIISCQQKELARVSQPFPDQSMRLLFLLNNTHLMWQQLRHSSYSLGLFMLTLDGEIDYHIQRYLQASWIPIVSGLPDPTPLCLGRYSPLAMAKFETEFQKTYTAQRLWKVPDPKLRRRLRGAIIETVIPAFAKYLEGNKITAPRVTQQELEDMLLDLFEG